MKKWQAGLSSEGIVRGLLAVAIDQVSTSLRSRIGLLLLKISHTGMMDAVRYSILITAHRSLLAVSHHHHLQRVYYPA